MIQDKYLTVPKLQQYIYIILNLISVIKFATYITLSHGDKVLELRVSQLKVFEILDDIRRTAFTVGVSSIGLTGCDRLTKLFLNLRRQFRTLEASHYL